MMMIIMNRRVEILVHNYYNIGMIEVAVFSFYSTRKQLNQKQKRPTYSLNYLKGSIRQ